MRPFMSIIKDFESIITENFGKEVHAKQEINLLIVKLKKKTADRFGKVI